MKGSKYKILSHTADLRLEVYGKTLEELFENAAEALGDILSPERKDKKKQAIKKSEEAVRVRSVNPNALLVDFLNEILAKSHINKKVYKISNVKIQISNKENAAEAELIGLPVKEFDEDIKAVTYHEVNLQQTIHNKQNIWHAKLVLDI